MTVERAKELIGKEGAVSVPLSELKGTCTIVYVDYDNSVLVKYVDSTLKRTKWYRLDEIKELTKRPCTREELIEMLKKQGLPMLMFKYSGYMYSVVKFTYNEVTFTSDAGGFSYTYEELCNKYTLLDGTELWVKQHASQCISPTPDEIGG